MRSSKHLSRTRQSPLWLEELEARTLLSGSQPTAAEQLFLEELNDTRANPAAYGISIGLDLSSVAPSQPLAFNPLLIQAAEGHSLDMNNRAYFSHVTPEGADPGQRIFAAGFPATAWGESIAAGTSYAAPADALSALIIDSGVSDLGHRRHLLAIDSIFQPQNQVGVGVLQNGSGPYVNYYTIDTASSVLGTGPFITGVVFNDLNGNGHYDIGEGLGGITITVSGAGSTTTYDSGGYSLAVNPGTYTVTATGSGLSAPITQTITVGANNYRLNFNAATGSTESTQGYVSKLYREVLGRTASGAEVAYWDAVMYRSGMGAVASGIEQSVEARDRLVRSWYLTYLGRAAGNGEEQSWVNLLERGVAPEEVLSDILASDEFFARAGSLNNAGNASASYVEALYSLLLNRTPGQAEVNSWVSQLGTMGRVGVVKGFLYSVEYRANVIRAYYTGLLHRTSPPLQSEIDYWVYSGKNLVGIKTGFEGSAEFAING